MNVGRLAIAVVLNKKHLSMRFRFITTAAFLSTKHLYEILRRVRDRDHLIAPFCGVRLSHTKLKQTN